MEATPPTEVALDTPTTNITKMTPHTRLKIKIFENCGVTNGEKTL